MDHHRGRNNRNSEENLENLIFGTRAVIEAISAGKEIDKIIIQKGLSNQLYSELRKAIKQYDLTVTNEQVELIIKEIDYFGNGKINYTEFMTATLDVTTALDNFSLKAIFSQFDTDNSGFITRDNIVTALDKMG